MEKEHLKSINFKAYKSSDQIIISIALHIMLCIKVGS